MARTRRLHLAGVCTSAVFLVVAAAALAVETTPVDPFQAAQKDVTQGALRIVQKDGVVVECPLTHTDVKAEIAGFIARVKVTQTFYNPTDEKIEAVYVFPLPHKSAVDDMTMVVGERRIVGLIKRRAEARAIYEQALQQGLTAALLEQERPNIFTQSVGNIDPRQEVRIEISYVDVLEYDMGTYEFHFPMVVGPRYIPGGATSKIPPVPPELKGKVGKLEKGRTPEGTKDPKGTGWAPDTDRVPDASRITPPVLKPGFRNGHDISLFVTLNAGVPIQDLKITSHKSQVQTISDRQAAVKLSPADSIPNKAFVLRYAVAGKKPEMAVLSHTDTAGQGYFMLMIQPQEDERLKRTPPREIVFLCDVSGSMSGPPTAKVVDAMGKFLRLCKPEDTVQVITFESNSRKLFDRPVAVTDGNIKTALNYTQRLQGGGGTEMLKGIKMAIEEPIDKDRVRIVLLMTDGYIGNEAEIIAEVGRRCGDQVRFWCVGIGSDPNRFLLDGVAKQGGGMSKTLGLKDDPTEMVQEVMFRIHRAQLSKISINWGPLNVYETYPARIPELWAGRPVVLFGLYGKGGGGGQITINGSAEGQPVTWLLSVGLPRDESKNDVLAKVWARQKIEDLMQSTFCQGSPEVEDEVTSIALDYRLMSQYTSFVAVDESKRGQILEPARPPRRMLVPVPLPEGTRFEGFFGGEQEELLVAGDALAAVAAEPPARAYAYAPTAKVPAAVMAPSPTMPAKRALRLSLSSPVASSRPASGPAWAVASGELGGGRANGRYRGGRASNAEGLFETSDESGVAPLADAKKQLVDFDGDVGYFAQALALQNQELAKQAGEVLKAAEGLRKKGDLLAARSKYAMAWFMASAATGSGLGSHDVAAQALAAADSAGDDLVKTWATDVSALQKRLDLVIRNQSLAEALDAVAREAGISIKLIPGSAEDAAALTLQRDIRVTYLDLRNATVAEALEWILMPERMAWWVSKGSIVAGTVRRSGPESPWVYDVSLLALPSAKELGGIKDYNQRVEAARKQTAAFLKAVRGALGSKDDACFWYAPGQVVLYANADVHAAASKLFADLADPKVKMEGALADLQKTAVQRAESRREPAARMAAAREVGRVAESMREHSWKLLAVALAGKLDLEALTELQAAWASPEAAEILKGKGAAVALRSLWTMTEAGRALPKEKELGVLVQVASRAAAPAAKEAVAALEKLPDDPSVFGRALYAALAFRSGADFAARARPLLAPAKDPKSPFAAVRTLATALLAPANEIDAKALSALALGDLRGEDRVVLAAMACRRAGGDAWTIFRAESRRILGDQPLPGSVVVLVNNLARPNLVVAAATGEK